MKAISVKTSNSLEIKSKSEPIALFEVLFGARTVSLLMESQSPAYKSPDADAHRGLSLN